MLVEREKLQSQASTTSPRRRDRQTSIDFWEGVLGMPFSRSSEPHTRRRHLYLTGRRRLITVFTRIAPDPTRTSTDTGAVTTSRSPFDATSGRRWSDSRSQDHAPRRQDGVLDSTTRNPLGLLIELASYRFEAPFGYTHADVLLEAHKLRVERGDYNIDKEHLADAIEMLVGRSRASLSEDRSPKDPY